MEALARTTESEDKASWYYPWSSTRHGQRHRVSNLPVSSSRESHVLVELVEIEDGLVVAVSGGQVITRAVVEREKARHRLLTAGILATGHKAPKGAVALTPEQLEELGQLAPGAPSIAQLINEDRGD